MKYIRQFRLFMSYEILCSSNFFCRTSPSCCSLGSPGGWIRFAFNKTSGHFVFYDIFCSSNFHNSFFSIVEKFKYLRHLINHPNFFSENLLLVFIYKFIGNKSKTNNQENLENNIEVEFNKKHWNRKLNTINLEIKKGLISKFVTQMIQNILIGNFKLSVVLVQNQSFHSCFKNIYIYLYNI